MATTVKEVCFETLILIYCIRKQRVIKKKRSSADIAFVEENHKTALSKYNSTVINILFLSFTERIPP